MKYSKIRRENDLKELRYFILTGLKELALINELEFKTYGTMIIKMYELNYYDEYEHILENIEEEALVKIIEFMIQLVDEDIVVEIEEDSNLSTLIRSITAICIQKGYSELADSLVELNEMFE
ncbi:hypothetical protein [Clostridium perfringens]|uniref:hypothetical protein n=1 Tax=Clostridium perfringens TaxID=1502 RepID=UPI00103ECDAB|nr:hypothetical protein [Clostridium perfringens]MBI5977633.1 hypothetical protein [Clostridium perfringens]MBI5980533.1 hypothetical protein [Clostridium perfringens]MDK0614910.1 hypothetical protein [Clostridium perfringens]TBX07215.1 hypothetical protein BFS03_11070 [Clostridium perfringens]UUR80981.1 hypothetical protein NQ196_14560 [Clostridium perfringens]